MKKAKMEAEQIMQAMLPLAKQMLEKYGEFLPYGAGMTAAGEVVSIAGDIGQEKPSSQDMINFLKNSFRDSVRSKEYKATGIFFDVRVTVPGSNEKTDAIAIALDHKDSYSVVVYVHYKVVSGKVQLGQVFATAGASDIFSS